MYFSVFIYLREIRWRLFYWLLSFISSFSVLFWYHKIILLTSFYPIISHEHRRFISLNVTELFTSITLTIFFITCLVLLNYTKIQLILFFAPLWSYLQTKLLCTLFKLTYLQILFFYFLANLVIVPKILLFFLFWELKSKYELLQIVVESRLDNYLSWIISTNFCLTNMLSLLVTSFFWLFVFLGVFPIYNFVTNYKPQITFAVFSSFSFLLFFDIPSQILFFLLLIFFLELAVFFSGVLVSCMLISK